MGVSLEGRMTNCCLLLISFVVKSPLIRDCLVEIALHQTQLEPDSSGNIAEEHIRPGSHLPFKLLGMGSSTPSPKISPSSTPIDTDSECSPQSTG
jgi:hypothetical protein